MKKVELIVDNIVNGFSHNNTYTVLLKEVKGRRKLPITIGACEAQQIAIPFNKMTPPRPLTHHLIKSILEKVDVHLQEVFIYNLQEGVYYAKLICIKDNEELSIDSRSSDGIALALHFGCPLYIHESIMEVASIIVEGSDEEPEESDEEDTITDDDVSEYVVYNIEELEAMMHEALEQEDYEKAVLIRDEINKRKNN